MSLEAKKLMRLEKGIERIQEIGLKQGLDFFPTNFEIVPAEIMYELAAYGMPGRFSHWSFGRTYQQLKTRYDYGYNKIYELVVNTNPSTAFLLENNPVVENLVVAGHVIAHVDFFKNNISFAQTNRGMANTAAAHAERIRKIESQEGHGKVENFLDSVLSIEWNITGSQDMPDYNTYAQTGEKEKAWQRQNKSKPKSEYDELFNIGVEKKDEEPDSGILPVPWQEEQDLLWFIANQSDVLKPWQQEIIGMIRSEMVYFYPQLQTRVMNEGWAAYWHQFFARELAEEGFSDTGEFVDFSKMHSGVVAGSRNHINPYGVGLAIWHDLDRKYEGLPLSFGKQEKDYRGEIIDPKSYLKPSVREQFDKFSIRRDCPSDQNFFRNYLSDALIEELELFHYALKGNEWVITERDPEVIRDMLLSDLTNFGNPVIKVTVDGGRFKGRELKLKHVRERRDLDREEAKRVLVEIEKLWGHPVNLETETNADEIVMRCERGVTKEEKKQKTAAPAVKGKSTL